MKNLLFAFTAAAALLIAVPSFACDGHAKGDKEESTTTASAEGCGCESCASGKDCASCSECSGKKAKEKTAKTATDKKS